MKTKILSLAVLSIWSMTNVFAQDRTTVTAANADISDNLDLRAVASIFGDSRNLDDFERRLNDPNSQISNLDLNGDNRVDYLRVIETVEGNAHIIVIQSVLGRDMFQDIASIEVERDRYNKVQVQVVGDVYMYGDNYIYEPVYVSAPVIYTSFWVSDYRPYCSTWYWGYYPRYFVAWTPFPVYTYHSHIGIYINFHNHYNYVNYRRCGVAYNTYYNGRRGNAYERQYPNRSFTQRNTGYVNRRELVNNRPQVANTRSNVAGNTRNNSSEANSPRPTRTFKGNKEIVGSESTPRSNGTRNVQSPRSVTTQNGRETTTESSPRTYGNTRNNESPRTYGNTRSSETPRTYGNTRSAESPRTYGNSQQTESSPRTYGNSSANGSPRGMAQGNSRGNQSPRTESAPRVESSPRMNQQNQAPRSQQREFSQQRSGGQRSGGDGNSRGNSNRRS